MQSLTSLIAREGPLSVRDAVGWTVRLGLRLLAMHERGQAHGRVTPHAVWVTSVDCASLGALIPPDDLPEEPTARCPESDPDGPPTPADDTWALGTVLYYVLTGVPPFRDAQSTDSWRAITPLVVHGAGHEVLQGTLDRVFDRRPEKRMSDIKHLIETLILLHPASASLPPLKHARPGSLPDDWSSTPSEPVDAAPSKPVAEPERQPAPAPAPPAQTATATSRKPWVLPALIVVLLGAVAALAAALLW